MGIAPAFSFARLGLVAKQVGATDSDVAHLTELAQQVLGAATGADLEQLQALKRTGVGEAEFKLITAMENAINRLSNARPASSTQSTGPSSLVAVMRQTQDNLVSGPPDYAVVANVKRISGSDDIVFSAYDGKHVVFADTSGQVAIVAPDQKTAPTWVGASGGKAVTCIVVNADATRVAYTTSDMFFLRELPSGKELARAQAMAGARVCFAAQGDRLAFDNTNNQRTIIDAITGKTVAHTPVTPIASKHIANSTAVVSMYDSGTATTLSVYPALDSYTAAGPYASAGMKRFSAFSVDPSGSTALCLERDLCLFQTFSLEKKTFAPEVSHFAYNGTHPMCATLTADQRWIAFGFAKHATSEVGGVVIYDRDTKTYIDVAAEGAVPTEITWAPDGRSLTVTRADNTLDVVTFGHKFPRTQQDIRPRPITLGDAKSIEVKRYTVNGKSITSDDTVVSRLDFFRNNASRRFRVPFGELTVVRSDQDIYHFTLDTSHPNHYAPMALKFGPHKDWTSASKTIDLEESEFESYRARKYFEISGDALRNVSPEGVSFFGKNTRANYYVNLEGKSGQNFILPLK